MNLWVKCMESWVIFIKSFILLYCTVKYILGDMRDAAVVLLFILAYVCFSMLPYILRQETLKRIFLLAALALLTFCAFYQNPLFAFLLPIQGAELLGRFTKDARLLPVPAVLGVVPADKSLLPEYILAALFSLTAYLLADRAWTRIQMLTAGNDQLHERNESLYRRLDRSAEYEGQLKYLSQLEERNRLAQNIHDKVGHAIAGSLIQLQAASALMEKDRDKAGEIVSKVIQVLQTGMEDIRSTLRSIKPASEQLGVHRLKVLLDEFSLMNPINTRLTYNGNLGIISHLQWKIILDNVKEALTNTLKYAKASLVTVHIEVLNRMVKIEIRDNGAGAYSIKKGLGIRGMEERTENAGGKLILDGTRGFSIITLLPAGEVTNANQGTDR